MSARSSGDRGTWRYSASSLRTSDHATARSWTVGGQRAVDGFGDTDEHGQGAGPRTSGSRAASTMAPAAPEWLSIRSTSGRVSWGLNGTATAPARWMAL